MILIGSQALKRLGMPLAKGILRWERSDYDIVASQRELDESGFQAQYNNEPTVSEVVEGRRIEWHSPEHLNNYRIEAATIQAPNYRSDYLQEFGITVAVAPAGVMYAIKRSHIWRPIKFAKHIQDLQWLSKQCYPKEVQTSDFYQERLRLTRLAYGDRHPSLKMSNDEFFDDVVDKFYIHDDIHKIVAFSARPVYELMKHDPESAMCSRDLWDALPFTHKVWAVQEEAMVIALERFLIPSLKGLRERPVKERPAFLMALEKICTTLTSGYFRDFAIDNYGVCSQLSVSPVELFKKGESKCRKYQKPQ